MARSILHRVFQENERDLITFMAARLQCSFTAHDLAQELFLKISALESVPDITNAKAYIYRMAANLVTDHQRREQRQRSLLSEVGSILWEGAGSLSPEQQVMAQQELNDLAAALAQLTPTTRRIFRLNRFEGKTQREIAQELGISRTAVEKHIRKALKKLAEHRHDP